MANKPNVKISKDLRGKIQHFISGSGISAGDFVDHAVRNYIFQLERLSKQVDDDVKAVSHDNH